MKKLNLIFLFVLLISCEKDELPINKHSIGEVESYQVVKNIYENQIFYSLETNNSVKDNVITEWDIAFENTKEGWKVLINSSRYSDVTEFEDYNFEDQITQDEINSAEKRWENPKGTNYETAIGDYREKNSVYVINRGYDVDNNPSGYKKITIDTVNNQYYSIKYSNLDNSNTKNIQITKQDTTHFQYFSFDSDNVVEIEPHKEKWDLLFTQYTHLYNDNESLTPYSVRGVLTNYLSDIIVAKDTTEFENISYDMINTYTFSNNQDYIGYAWKTFANGNYIINSDTTYIIKSLSDRYFKLRFIGFWSPSSLERGFPEIEIQEL